MQRIAELAWEKLGIADEHLEPYGHYKAKVSLDYLESLFGDGVSSALATITAERAKKAAGETSELMDTLIGYRHAEMFKLS